MLEFKTLEDLQANEELQNMPRYSWKKVKLNNEEVFACTTNQQYEDIIWGNAYEMLTNLFDHFQIEDEEEYNRVDLSSEIRDFVLERLEEQGIKFFDVFDEY